MQKFDLDELNAKIKEESTFVEAIFDEVSKVIIGQKEMIERLIIGVLCNGHVLLEGVPGLAKTATVQSIASAFSVNFNRIQFTPDLLPADLIGTLIYDPQQATFYTKKGPIFTNIVLADEINRAPAKVQSALLEAMQERQVSIGDETHLLNDPFLVLATQNPIEQEGTYPLPEAQVDRFMLKVKVDYPTNSEELAILRRMTYGDITPIKSGGYALLQGRVRKQITGNLFENKLIEGHIGIESLGYPISIRPNFPVVIYVHSVCVAISRSIKPVTSAMLTRVF